MGNSAFEQQWDLINKNLINKNRLIFLSLIVREFQFFFLLFLERNEFIAKETKSNLKRIKNITNVIYIPSEFCLFVNKKKHWTHREMIRFRKVYNFIFFLLWKQLYPNLRILVFFSYFSLRKQNSKVNKINIFLSF